MSVHLTRIYTKTGDDGTTALGDMSRVREDRPRASAPTPTSTRPTAPSASPSRSASCRTTSSTLLTRIQNDLFDVGRRPVHAVVPDPKYPPLRITDADVERLESGVRRLQRATLEKLSSFILPGGTPGAALLHQVRTIVRRAERATWALLEAEPERTSTHARALPQPAVATCCSSSPDAPAGGGEVLWQPGGGERSATRRADVRAERSARARRARRGC